MRDGKINDKTHHKSEDRRLPTPPRGSEESTHDLPLPQLQHMGVISLDGDSGRPGSSRSFLLQSAFRA